MSKRIGRAGQAATALVAGGAALGTLLGLCGGLAWWMDLFSHFQLQYALLLMLCIIAQLLLRPRWLAAVWAVPLAVNLVLITPLYLGSRDGAPHPLLSVLHINLDRNLDDITAAIKVIHSQRAEIVFLQEVTPQALVTLERLQGYRLLMAQAREDSRGVAALVRRDASIDATPRVIQLRPDLTDRPTIELLIDITPRPLALLSLHVKRPSNSDNSAIQRAELAAANSWAREQIEQGRSVVLIGDLNATPWSSASRVLTQGGMLRNSQRGFGIQPTWPAPLIWPLRIPIDHCYHSQDLVPTGRVLGPSTGSDHLPLKVELGQRDVELSP